MQAWAILIASGKEEQISEGIDSAFLSLGARPVIGHSLLKFEREPSIKSVIVVVNKECMDRTLHLVKLLGCAKVRHIVAGGTNRATSLKSGMKYLPEKDVLVVVHEASRPAFEPEVLELVVRTARRYGCAVAAAKIPDVVKTTNLGVCSVDMLDRGKAWSSQTPLAFKQDLYERAMHSPARKEVRFSDDESAYIQAAGEEVRLVESSFMNLKIRSASDLALLSTIVREV
jgi:2-C-methyl-D-erythritol 4-phosphate cytidylyltransferase